MKTSVISDDFRQRFLSTPGSENCFTARVIVFDGPEDYRRRINDPALADRRNLHAGGARRGPDRLSRVGGSGQHDAAGLPGEAAASACCRAWATGGRAAPPTARRF